VESVSVPRAMWQNLPEFEKSKVQGLKGLGGSGTKLCASARPRTSSMPRR